jgi:histidinol-phosphate aminotransferase
MIPVPSYIQSLQPYKAGKPIDEVKREYGLTEVIKLASNENPLGASPLAIEEMKLQFNDLQYYPNGGYDLRVALAAKYNVKVENVITGSGSEGIMLNILRTFLQPGDEVLTTESAFIGFHVLAHAHGLKYTTVPYNNWHYDLPALANKINPNTRLIYLASPNNPTGTIFTKQEFDEFYSKVPEHILIIFDEAYFEYAIGNPLYPDSMRYRYDNVITLRTFSKVYGLAGLRIGYGFAHEDLIGHMLKVKLPFEPSVLAQSAALGALKDTDFLARSVSVNAAGRTYIAQTLQQMGITTVPSEANFIMAVLQSRQQTDHIFLELLKRGVIIRPLTAFGIPTSIRITIGTPEQNQILIEQFKDVVKSLPK